jgi:hypothetical protein
VNASPFSGDDDSQDGRSADSQANAYAQARSQDNNQQKQNEWREKPLPFVGEDHVGLHHHDPEHAGVLLLKG